MITTSTILLWLKACHINRGPLYYGSRTAHPSHLNTQTHNSYITEHRGFDLLVVSWYRVLELLEGEEV